MPESALDSKVYKYLNQNQDYIVNYEERKGLGKTFNSSDRVSYRIINVRHKRVEMQWVGKGRTTFFKSAQIGQWQQAVLSALEQGI